MQYYRGVVRILFEGNKVEKNYFLEYVLIGGLMGREE